jgi:hypothetical protein
MVVRYHHTQSGAMMLTMLLFASILSTWVGYLLNASSRAAWPLFASAIGLAILAWLFSSLTVEVTEQQFRRYFGPGVRRYRIELTEIEDIQIVHNKWWNGFGIRISPG